MGKQLSVLSNHCIYILYMVPFIGMSVYSGHIWMCTWQLCYVLMGVLCTFSLALCGAANGQHSINTFSSRLCTYTTWQLIRECVRIMCWESMVSVKSGMIQRLKSLGSCRTGRHHCKNKAVMVQHIQNTNFLSIKFLSSDVIHQTMIHNYV